MRALARARDLEVAIDFARVIGRHQVLAAILDPFDRTADMAGRERDEEILGIKLAAHAEAAADIELDHVDGLLGKAQHGREHATVEEQDLGGAENDKLLLRSIPFGDEAAGLQRHRGQAVTAKALAAGVLGLGESRVGIARRDRVAHRAVAAARFEQQRLVACRRVAIRQRRQRCDIDIDRLEGVFSQRLGLRHNHRDRFADVAHLVLGDDRLQVGREFRKVRKPQWDQRNSPDLGRGDHRSHALARPRGRRIDAVDASMRDAAAQDHRVQHPGALQVVDECPRTGEKAPVFRPIDRLTDQRRGWHVHG